MQIEHFFFFSSPDWVKYRYSQLTKVLNIILVHPWKGSVTKRKPNKKSSEPGQTWVRVYKTCSERVPPQALGVPTISHYVCCLSFDECTYPLVLLLKLGDGVDWACKSVPQGMDKLLAFYSKCVWKTEICKRLQGLQRHWVSYDS